MSDKDDLAPIREAVRALCKEFPGEYWRKLDRERAYPKEFVAARQIGCKKHSLSPSSNRSLDCIDVSPVEFQSLVDVIRANLYQ